MSDVIKFEEATAKKAPRTSAERQRAFKLRRKLAAEQDSDKFDSRQAASKADTRKILDERGVRNRHVLDVLIDLGEIASQANHIIQNHFFWQNGPTQAIESNAAGKPLPMPEVEDEVVPGELVCRRDLYALWQFSVAWRPDRMTFQEFLNTRRLCKTNCFRLGKEILGKDFHSPHQAWSDFFPKFNPELLKPDYSQEEMKAALSSISDIKTRLLLASRNSYKSSFSLVWLLQAILFCPDIRALLVSETKPLSRGFIRGFRAYWEIKNPNTPTMFQQLFPEYCIPVEKGSELTFESPMARLDLIQSTAESTSMDSTVAGNRADVIIFDDPISNVTVGNETQRQASVEKYDLMLKLLEVGSLGIIVLGTPWHQQDLYATLLARNEADDEKPLLFRIDPAFQVKESAKKKDLLALTEDDVVLLFPSRLTFKFLRSELKNNPRVFRTQNLCEFVPEEEDLLKVTFTEDDLRKHTRPISFFEPMTSETVMSVDTAFSTSRFADMSCIVIGTISRRDDKNIFVTVDVDMDRWKQSELAIHIVEAIHKHNPGRVLIERIGPWQALAEAVKNAAMIRGYLLPHIYWKPVNLGGTAQKTKAARIKGLEPLLARGQLWFVSAHWNDIALEQMVKFDGVTKSNSHRKDDFADCLALAVEAYFPRDDHNPEQSSEFQKADDEARDAAARQSYYNRMFGVGVSAPANTIEKEPENNSRGIYGIPGLRMRPGQETKTPTTGFHSSRKVS